MLSPPRLILPSTSKAAYTSTATPRGIPEVRFLSEEYVHAVVLVGDRITTSKISSFRFTVIIHHLKPTTNDAGPRIIEVENTSDAQTWTVVPGI